MIFRYALGASIVSLAMVSVSRANILINGSLETTKRANRSGLVYAYPTFNSRALDGWTITGGRIDVVPQTYWQSSAGNFSVDMIGTPSPGSIMQRFNTTPGDTYSLTFDFSVNPDTITGEQGTTKVLQIKTLGADNKTVIGSEIYSDTVGDRTRENMMWEEKSFSFVATGTKTTLVISALSPGGLPGRLTVGRSKCGPVIDNLDLENLGGGEPTPEPASLTLLGAGGLLLLKRRRRA